MAVPPLHHGVHGARVHGIGLGEGDRDGHAVDDVQHGDGDDEGAIEPVGHVDVLLVAPGDGAEEDHRITDPHHGDEQVDGPLQLRVLLALGDAQGQRHRGEHDHQLPAPEGERGQLVAEQPHPAGALHDVVGGGEQGAAAEGEDDRVGVQRAQPAEGQPRQVEVERRPEQLGGDQHAHRHADDAPDHGHHGELPDDLVVVHGCGCR